METRETIATFKVYKVLKTENIELNERIIGKAMELFMRYGIKSVTMDDISRGLAVSKKTLYQEFPDKNTLVLACAKQHFKAQIENINSITSKGTNTMEEMVLLSRCIREDVSTINPAVIYDMKKYFNQAWDIFNNFKYETLHNMMIDLLERGKDEGYIRPEINTEVIATMRIAETEMALDEDLFPKRKFKLHEVQMIIFDHFVHGVTTEKGKNLYKKYLNNQ